MVNYILVWASGRPELTIAFFLFLVLVGLLGRTVPFFLYRARFLHRIWQPETGVTIAKGRPIKQRGAPLGAPLFWQEKWPIKQVNVVR